MVSEENLGVQKGLFTLVDQKPYHWVNFRISQKLQRISRQTYGDPSLHSSILSGTLPIKFPAASNYDFCLHSWVPCLRSSSLYLNWERTFRQKDGVIIGFTSFVSLFAGIKVLCFLLSKIWKHLLHFGSFLQLFMSRRRAHYQCDLAIAKMLEIIIPSKYLLGYKVFLKPRNKWFS